MFRIAYSTSESCNAKHEELVKEMYIDSLEQAYIYHTKGFRKIYSDPYWITKK